MSKCFLFALLIGLALAVLNQAQDQSGFISIDCGLLPANAHYSEPKTKLNYISDANFINSGIRNIIPDEVQKEYQRQMWNLRSFPEPEEIRNCYRINVTRGSKYLIRASFLYGNYDGLNDPPVFDLHLGPNFWDTVQITNTNNCFNYEIIHVPTLDYVHICLVKTGFGTPFITSIELRPLKNNTYIVDSGSLALWKREDLGSTKAYRFGFDVYDRFWYSNGGWGGSETDWTTLNVTIPVNFLWNNDFKLPEIVMSTMVTPVKASTPLKFSWTPASASNQYYVYMHFAELQELPKNETRAFNVILNGQLLNATIAPKYLTAETHYTREAFSGERIEILLVKTEKSTLPPILNAIEIYTVKEFPQSETHQEDFDAITSIRSTYALRKNWQGDPCNPVDFRWDGLNCSNDGYKTPRITTLKLSSSGLTGEIDPSISKLTMLEKLDLSNNSLNGEVPDFLSQLEFLTSLNLENNNLTGPIPAELIEKSRRGILSMSLSQNPYLCDSPACTNIKNNNNKSKNATVPVVASVCGILIFLAVVAVLFWTLKRTKPKHMTIERDPNDTLMKIQKRQYSYSDVINITNNFDKIIGKGGFGTVYLGFIDDIHVAVKMLSPSSAQGYQQFQAEVKLLMTVHHRNLTSLIGYCNEETNKGLIYEYMANGNLNERLSGRHSKSKFLTWEDRLQISIDTAQGLEYLHNGCKPPITHRDIKSTNILLNEHCQAKISDFGLSKTMVTTLGGTQLPSLVGGTPGYLDPEFYRTSRLTYQSDVYSFGVVLLELITNQQPVIERNNEMIHISQWVNSMVTNGDIKQIVYSRLQGGFNSNSAWKAVEIAMACVSPNSKRRPTMTEVVIELKECLATALPLTSQSGVSATGLQEEVIMNLSVDTTPLAR
ncbi:hypothetical protein L6164_028817 [Bauhinia variegata]|uniref:Uncharacterized protein n=1 Tax=Bauhinia variegata TaxID=167791 RepID=A0ACB9L7L8_BAUVA|nr:hypothetical protein L6164_028817 [Bauhinia variegata]